MLYAPSVRKQCDVTIQQNDLGVRVAVVETKVDDVEGDVRRLEGQLIHLADKLDLKFTWLIGLVVMILIAIIANGVMT